MGDGSTEVLWQQRRSEVGLYGHVLPLTSRFHRVLIFPVAAELPSRAQNSFTNGFLTCLLPLAQCEAETKAAVNSGMSNGITVLVSPRRGAKHQPRALPGSRALEDVQVYQIPVSSRVLHEHGLLMNPLGFGAGDLAIQAL